MTAVKTTKYVCTLEREQNLFFNNCPVQINYTALNIYECKLTVEHVFSVCLQRQSGGVAMGPQNQLPGVVHPQQQFYPSQPIHPHEIALQEVPEGHNMCPTGKK